MNGRQVADAARVLRPGRKMLLITGSAESAAVSKSDLDELADRFRSPIEA